jgi:hypothetical protein
VTEILFIVEEATDGYRARAVGAGISTQGSTREELQKNVRQSIESYFIGNADEAPKVAHLHYVRDETIPLTQNATRSNGSSIREKLRGSVLRDLDPYGPAVPPEDWKATG